MEHKDVQAYLKHNQENQTDFDDPYQEYYQKQNYETNYEMRVNDNRKLPNYVFSFALPGDGVGQRRQKVKCFIPFMRLVFKIWTYFLWRFL